MSTQHADLVAAATIGTRTRRFTTAALASPVAEAGGGSDGAEALLDAAAAYAVVRRSRIPTPEQLRAVDLPADDRPLVGAAFASLLRAMIGGSTEQKSLLAEALTAFVSRGGGTRVALPPSLVIGLLETQSRPGTGEVRQALVAALGERDRAVAALNPEWERRLADIAVTPTSAAADVGQWTSGTHAQRLALLRALRRDDPARARTLLADGTWVKEPAGRRVELLETVAQGITAADQEFLTAAMQDRAASVRRVAADLLGRIPGSPVVTLAEETALAHLRVTLPERRPGGLVGRLLGGAHGEHRVVLEARGVAADPALAEAGLDARTNRERLAAVLGAVPPDRWPTLVGATAVDLATAVTTVDGVADFLSDAWAAAASRWRHADLALQLLNDRELVVDGIETFVEDDRLEAALAALLPEMSGTVAPLLHRLPRRLSRGTAEILCDLLPVWRGKRMESGLAADLIAHGAPLSSATALAERITAVAEGAENPRSLVNAAGLLRLRGALHDALNACPELTQEETL
ncbi:MAG: DUF5691 domain-containing protein [Propioniciclava sp.]